jgi:hypothetical protein
VVPSESILEQQRRLLASIESIEGLASGGQLRECLRLIEEFESDLGSAIDAPILVHLQSRLAAIHDRVRSLATTVSGGSTVPVPKIVAQKDPSVGRRGGMPAPAARSGAALGLNVRAEDDPLAEYRGGLGEAVPAPDLNGHVSVFDTTQIWWRCGQNPKHHAWKATKAQTARGRPCPSCMAEAGLTPNAWFPTDTGRGAFWLDAHNHAMLWNMGGF